MKTTNLLMMTALAILAACQGQSVDGDCPDPITTSPTQVQMGAMGGEQRVRVSKQTWWIGGPPEVVDCTPPCHIEGLTIVRDSTRCSQLWEGDSLRHIVAGEVLRIESPWYIIHKSDDNQIDITLKPNNTGSPRKLSLALQAGNCFKSLYIIQEANQ